MGALAALPVDFNLHRYCHALGEGNAAHSASRPRTVNDLLLQPVLGAACHRGRRMEVSRPVGDGALAYKLSESQSLIYETISRHANV